MTTAPVNLSYVEKAKQYQRDYYQKNREKRVAYARKQLAERKEEINARRRELARLKGIPERVKLDLGVDSSDKPEYNRKYHLEVKSERNLVQKYRALKIVSKTGAVECGVCKETDIRVLTINHIDGNGRQENSILGFLRRRILSGERSVDDLEVLCFNCNIRYEYVRGRSRLPSNWEEVLEKLRAE
jgi:hypothetical protein